jgi:hypothetical protein
MSGGKACQCSEKREPITAPANSSRPGRLWRVVQYRCNHSAFNGYHTTSSAYSSIACIRCGARWRTKAPYADILASLDPAERDISSGFEGHEAAMEALGRKPGRD